MTEQNRDDRLDEIVREFIGSTGEESPNPSEGQQREHLTEDPSDLHQQQNEQIESLRAQMLALHDEIILQREANLQNSHSYDLSALQEMYISQAAKIEDLEYKQRMLKADVKIQSEKKTSGFGNWGWFLVTSNILIWSMLGWFLWDRYADQSNFENTSDEVVKINEYEGLDEVTDNEYVPIADNKVAKSVQTTAANNLAKSNETEYAQEVEQALPPVLSKEEKEEWPAVSNAKEVQSNNAAGQVKAQKKATSESKIKSIAAQENSLKKAAKELQQEKSSSTQPVKKSPERSKKQTLSTDAQPSHEDIEPPIRFGD